MISLCACTPSLEVDTIEVGVVRALCIDEREREYSQLRLISYCNSGIVPTVSITFYFPSSLGISPLFTQLTENLSQHRLSAHGANAIQTHCSGMQLLQQTRLLPSK